jgi:hypothetical protein
MLKNYILKAGFLDGTQGFLYCFLTALYPFVIQVKLWDLKRRHNAGESAQARSALRALRLLEWPRLAGLIKAAK